MGGKGSGRKPTLLPCGTVAAYSRHRKKGEDCAVCRKAAADQKRQNYKPKRPKSRHDRIQGRNAIIEEKLRRKECLDCGLEVTLENYVCFDFDHRDPAEKSFAISSKAKEVNQQVLKDEFAKCDLVCANCHRLRTHKQFKTGVLTGMRKTQTNTDLGLTLFDVAG